jgi:hypothetical protein
MSPTKYWEQSRADVTPVAFSGLSVLQKFNEK